MESDVELIHRYANSREAEAFSELVRRHAGMVYAVARRVAESNAEAEDVCQLCFLELARKANSIGGSVAAWLHAVATRRAMDAARNRRTRRRHEGSASLRAEASGQQEAQERESLDAIVAHVDAALTELPEELREPIVDHYLRGRTQGAVASDFGVNQSTISRRLGEGIERLRQILADRGVVAPAMVLSAALGYGTADAAPSSVVAVLNKLALSGAGPAATTATAMTFWPLWVGGAALGLASMTLLAFWPRGGPIISIPLNQGAFMVADSKSTSAIGLSAIDQVSLTCTDLDVAERFYCGVLGLRLAGAALPSMKFFDCAGVNIIMNRADKVVPASIFYFKIEGVPGRIQEKVAALRAAGVAVDGDARRIAENWQGYDIWLAFFKDPFGNQLALKSDVPVGTAAAQQTSPVQAAGPALARIAPAFLVADADAAAAAAFYRDKLGFQIDLVEGREFAIVRSAGDQQIFLKRADDPTEIVHNRERVASGATYDAYIFTRALADVDTLFERYKVAGLDVKRTDWAAGANEEFRVRDLDGYELVIAHGQD